MTVYQYIRTENNPYHLYEGIREILRRMDERGAYPEDWTIKRIQRLADARYAELTREQEATV